MKRLYIILIIIFLFFYYKNSKLGNTIINLNEEKIIDSILSNNLKYQAETKIKIYSNKNENDYQLKIMENGEDALLEVIGNNSISGLRIEKKNGDLIVRNTKLKLDKIYKNYKEVTDSSLLLSSFAKEYNETSKRKTIEKNGQIIINITLKNNNKYIKYKELYLDNSTGMPKKMIIKDSSKQLKISIEYTSIEIL